MLTALRARCPARRGARPLQCPIRTSSIGTVHHCRSRREHHGRERVTQRIIRGQQAPELVWCVLCFDLTSRNSNEGPRSIAPRALFRFGCGVNGPVRLTSEPSCSRTRCNQGAYFSPQPAERTVLTCASGIWQNILAQLEAPIVRLVRHSGASRPMMWILLTYYHHQCSHGADKPSHGPFSLRQRWRTSAAILDAS